MARVIIDKALAGDVVTARFCLDRLEPRPRGRAISIELPEGARMRDVVAAFDATVRAMAGGEINEPFGGSLLIGPRPGQAPRRVAGVFGDGMVVGDEPDGDALASEAARDREAPHL